MKILVLNGSPRPNGNTAGMVKTFYPTAPATLKKVAMFLSSGDDNMYDGAKFSYDGDFLGYLGLEGMGIFTNHDKNVMSRIKDMASSL